MKKCYYDSGLITTLDVLKCQKEGKKSMKKYGLITTLDVMKFIAVF